MRHKAGLSEPLPSCAYIVGKQVAAQGSTASACGQVRSGATVRKIVPLDGSISILPRCQVAGRCIPAGEQVSFFVIANPDRSARSRSSLQGGVVRRLRRRA